MRRQHRGADAIGVEVGGAGRTVERLQILLEGAPAGGIAPARDLEAVLQARLRLVGGFLPARAEADGDQRVAIMAGEVELGAHGDIARLGHPVAFLETAMGVKLLPAVRGADIADRAGDERHRAGEGEGAGLGAGREQHRHALVVVHPGSVVGAGIDEMRREQAEHAVVGEFALQRLEGDSLQECLALRIGQDLLLDPPLAVAGRVHDPEGGDAFLDHRDRMVAVALFLGEIAVRAGDDEAEIAGTGGVDARPVDLVQDAVAEREPDAAGGGAGGSDAGLGARRPARRQAGLSRRCHLPGRVHSRFSVALDLQLRQQSVVNPCGRMGYGYRTERRPGATGGRA